MPSCEGEFRMRALELGLLWSLVFGLAGLIGGALGPALLTPNMSQGPFLVFFTFPGGLVLGGILGILYGVTRSRN